MRRWLALFLLVLLPLQSSWAAVAAYCGHESGARAQHVGHHDPHEHASQVAPALDGTPASPDLPDSVDCSHCHGSCASLPALPGGLQAQVAAGCHAHAPEGALSTRAQSPPERPQWQPLA